MSSIMDVPARLLLLFFAVNLLVDCANSLTFKLNDGNDIPAIALGTSLGHLPDGTRRLPKNQAVAKAVEWALDAGYRHVDTASLYRVEEEVGRGFRNFHNNVNYSDVTRQDLYITTKLWNDAHERDEVIPALLKSLEELQMDYVDLYLVHYPMAYKKDGSISDTDYLTTWLGMEDAKKMNLTRSIGVSNFNIKQMQRLWDNSKIKPAVLQIEVNPTITQDELVNWCRDHGVVVMAYSPFGPILDRDQDAPGPRRNDTFLQELSHDYGKEIPQILLRYLLDRNIVAIPRSTNRNRITMNFDIEDFNLTPAEVKKLSEFNLNYRLRTPVKWYDHPEFPFEKKTLTADQIKYIIEHSKED